jgi:hypothetical protein
MEVGRVRITRKTILGVAIGLGLIGVSAWTVLIRPAGAAFPGALAALGGTIQTAPSEKIAQVEASNAGQAYEQLRREGNDFTMIVVSDQSTGLEEQIYADLEKRNYRVAAGPDEGYDTSSLTCYPNCALVRQDALDAVPVETWIRILRHERRHMVQLKNDPSLARDFRSPDGTFTTFGAFSEACADYGLNVGEDYHAQERIDRLKSVLGSQVEPVLDSACKGDTAAYASLVQKYDETLGQTNAFANIFPPYH